MVRNPSFESYDSCYTNDDFVLFSCTDWDSVGVTFPDHFTYCNTNIGVTIPFNSAGYQVAKHGHNYIGLVCYMPLSSLENIREYGSSILEDTLMKDSVYYASCWIAMQDNSKHAINNFGIFLSHNIPEPNHSNNRLLDTIPQVRNYEYVDDSTRWYKVEGEFIATGGEKYITLGNFDHDSVIDSYRLYPYNNPNAGADYVYYIIDSVWLSLKSEVPIEPEDTVIVPPPPVDTTEGDTLVNFLQIFPNPSNGMFQLVCNEAIQSVSVYDEIGRLILRQSDVNTTLIDLSFQRAGTYIAEIHTVSTIYRRKLVLLRY